MRLVNVIALTNGLLINDPFVSNFTNIVFEVKAVKRGDLFIAFDKKNINDAIKNGAYGIVFDKPIKMIDNEIAWIKVDNVADALKRLLRFKLVEKEIIAYSCNEIALKLALQIMIDPKLIIVNGDIQKVSKHIWNIEPNSIVLFSPALCDEEIFTDIKPIQNTQKNILQITEKTLFETSFIYKEKLYERQMISPLFMNHLNNLVNFLQTIEVEFRFRKFTQLENFKPVFINNNFLTKEFGSGDKVIIFENNFDLVEKEIEFLQKNANWANIIYLLPKEYTHLLYSNLYNYKSKKDIIKILKKNTFNFALIFGSGASILESATTNQMQLTLDF